MAVDLYLYDDMMRLRGTAVWGITKLIHDERDFMLTAELASIYGVTSGQYVGFTCIDGRYRLFRVDKTETNVGAGMTTATATESAVAELSNSIVRAVRYEETDAATAAQDALEGSGFTLGSAATGRKGPVEKAYTSRWKVLREIESVCNVRVIPHYEMQRGQIIGRVVDVEEKTYRRTGRILQRETDATSIRISTSGCAIARLYGVGRSIGTEDPPDSVTFKNVVWSTANGDPMDKPAGADFLEDPELIARGILHEDVYENRYITDENELLAETYKEFLKRRKPKVSGVATVFDVEHMPGYEHKAVRLYDVLDVPTDDGGTVEGIVIDIQRDYVRPDLTQIVLGEEKDTGGIIRKVAGLANDTHGLRGSAAAASNRYIENKHLIQLNANRIILNAEEILAQAERIRLNAAAIDEATGRLTAAELILYGDGTTAQAGLVSRVAENEQAAEDLSVSFAVLENTTEEAYAALGARLGDAEASITATATTLGTRIDLKADKTYVETLIAQEIEAEIADLKLSYADYIQTVALSATAIGTNYIDTNTMSLGGATVKKTTLSVVTEFTQALGESAKTQEYTLLTCA